MISMLQLLLMSAIKIIMSSSRVGNMFATSAVSSGSMNSSKAVKLRTIMKGRGSQQGLIDTDPKDRSLSTNKLDDNDDKLSVSLNLNARSRLSQSHHQSQSLSRSSMRGLDTQNCEQELLGKQDYDYLYQKYVDKLNSIESEAEDLIRNKIHKIKKKSDLVSLKEKGKQQYS